MTPLLAITAGRVGAQVLQNVAENVLAKPAPAAPATDGASFQDVLARVAASPSAQRVRLLAREGIASGADAEARLGEIAHALTADPQLASLLGRDGATFEMRVGRDGEIHVRTADGRSRTVRLDGENGDLALRAGRILEALAGEGGKPATLRVTPGGATRLA